ncbi:hypothetical protein ACLOJK_000479 [Asimina triloba]
MGGEDSNKNKWGQPATERIGNLRRTTISRSDSDIFAFSLASQALVFCFYGSSPFFAQFQNPNSRIHAMRGSPSEHEKLCGFFCIVLSVKAPNPAAILSPGTPCSLYASASKEIGFCTESGVLLLPIVNRSNPTAEIDGEGAAAGKEALPANCRRNSSSRKKRRRGETGKSKMAAFLARRRKWKAEPGLGSWSIVHQVHVLVGHKCLKIDARVVWVLPEGVGGDGNEGGRAVVMVDVFLPIAVWSGWQLPKSRMAAAALFRHLSCNWEERNSLLAGDANYWKHCPGEGLMLAQSDCLVLGCEMHSILSGSAKRKLFELHEIFKSLPAIGKGDQFYSTKVKPAEDSLYSGIWDVSDDVLISVLTYLGAKDLVRVASTCRHLRSLAASIMPCMKLKLYPHQKAAVDWMLQRERNAELVPHPLFMDFSTEDGFHFYVSTVSGEISTGIAPTIMDFRGGMFCDEPGLGKTITALSLILKTQGTLADPPKGAEVTWCMHNADQRCGYYELGSENFTPGKFMASWKRFMGQNGRRSQICRNEHSTEHHYMENSNSSSSSKQAGLTNSEACVQPGDSSCTKSAITPTACVLRCTRSLGRVKRNLLDSFEVNSNNGNMEAWKNISHGKRGLDSLASESFVPEVNSPPSFASNDKKLKNSKSFCSEIRETWVQCDSCRKWRKVSERGLLGTTKGPWFCSMNSDRLHQSCAIPEEFWDNRRSITYLLGFYTKGSSHGMEQNVSFFTNVLKEHCRLINSFTKRALTWLSNLPDEKLVAMETFGLKHPFLDASEEAEDACNKIFKAFGLVQKVEKGTTKWHYPCNLENLAFDLSALRIALTRPLDSLRLYLSSATLIVVPSNLVDHWKTQIQKHVRPGQLRVYVWTEQKKPCAHNLAWDYDIVITTFNRLSAEWSSHKRSVLMQVHWLRVMLDEGHTLGSSLNLTNKLQMAVSLAASNRWVLTGTPTPNTPTSQVAHLQPMLKFLHEEAYGQNQKLWEAGILRPFEAEMEEGRLRLLQLLRRCMISARKEDLQTIPPCLKKVTTLDFTEEHARTYNELVVTVRRNILMADWNDPSHVESLLNPKQWKLRSNTIRNVRLSCCVAGHIKVTDAGQDIQETMDILVEQGLDPLSDEYAFIKYCLLNGGDCFRCKEWCRLPVITPCKHLLCLDCVALDSERCSLPGCGNPYEMQSPEILTRPENPNPKWPDDWDPDWQSTSSSKVAYLVDRLKTLQEVNRDMGYCMDVDADNNPPSNALVALHKRQWDKLIHQMASHGSHDKYLKALPEKRVDLSAMMKSLMIFQHDVNCMALLMDGSAALGLDLSFVTHVFLMEPIWDRRYDFILDKLMNPCLY